MVSSTFPNIALMHISVVDMCHEDLLCHFESAYKFIKEGVTRGAILVHCYHGVSLYLFFKDTLYIVKSFCNEVSREVHRGDHQYLFVWVLILHVCNDTCENLCLSSAWRPLNECNSLLTRISYRFSLADIEFLHSIVCEDKLECLIK